MGVGVGVVVLGVVVGVVVVDGVVDCVVGVVGLVVGVVDFVEVDEVKSVFEDPIASKASFKGANVVPPILRSIESSGLIVGPCGPQLNALVPEEHLIFLTYLWISLPLKALLNI